MTPRTFFTLLLKILGLYSILSSMTVVPQLLSTLFLFTNTEGLNHLFELVVTIFSILFVSGLFFLALYFCLFKTDWIIDKLSLDKHFKEEKLDITIENSSVLRISIMVIGGFLFIDSLPLLCIQVYDYFENNQLYPIFGDNPTTGWIIFYAIKTGIGYLLMTNSRTVVEFIERNGK